MPTKKQQKKTTPRLKKARKSGGQQSGAQRGASSIAAGYSTSRKQKMLFNGKECLTLKFTSALYEIGAGNATTDGLRGVNGVASQTSAVSLSFVNPGGYTAAGASTSNPYLSPGPDLISSCFTRVTPKGLRFRYCPQSGTNTTNRMVFGFAADSSNPLVISTAPSQVRLEALADSRPFAPWEEWEMDVSYALDKKTKLYTSDQINTTSAQELVNDRLNSLGSIGCMSSAAGTATTGDVFGVLYADMELEFSEFCPISVTRPTLHAQIMEQIHEPSVNVQRRQNGLNSSLRDIRSRKELSTVPRKTLKRIPREEKHCERCDCLMSGDPDELPLCQRCLDCPAYGGTGRCRCHIRTHLDHPPPTLAGGEEGDSTDPGSDDEDTLIATYSLSPTHPLSTGLSANKAIAEFIAFLDAQKDHPVNKVD